MDIHLLLSSPASSPSSLSRPEDPERVRELGSCITSEITSPQMGTTTVPLVYPPLDPSRTLASSRTTSHPMLPIAAGTPTSAPVSVPTDPDRAIPQLSGEASLHGSDAEPAQILRPTASHRIALTSVSQSGSVLRPPKNVSPSSSSSSAPPLTRQTAYCNQCGKSFAGVSSLNRHISRIHEHARPFRCSLCPAAFGERTSLDRHTATVHLKVRPHQCPLCSRGFGRADNLRIHIRTVHRSRTPQAAPLPPIPLKRGSSKYVCISEDPAAANKSDTVSAKLNKRPCPFAKEEAPRTKRSKHDDSPANAGMGSTKLVCAVENVRVENKLLARPIQSRLGPLQQFGGQDHGSLHGRLSSIKSMPSGHADTLHPVSFVSGFSQQKLQIPVLRGLGANSSEEGQSLSRHDTHISYRLAERIHERHSMSLPGSIYSETGKRFCQP